MKLESAIKNQQWTKVSRILDHDRELVQQLLTEDCDLLHNAIIYGAPADIITQLISPHNIKIQNENGITVLIEAVCKNRWELVPVLLQHGADVNVKNRWNQTPLYWAAHEGAPVDIITQLISSHNINIQDDLGITPLHAAVCKNRWELVPVLLQHGADVNVKNRWNQTPLYWAAHDGAPDDIITQLISRHNINIQNENGYTALHQAVWWERWDLVRVLLQHGADPSMLDTPQPDQPLVVSLQALCIATIRSHMPVKSDEAYEGLGLPVHLVSEVKLRPQAEDIVNRGR